MLQPIESSERRQNNRFKNMDGFCVLLRSQTNEELGFLVDISKEGASFEYIHTGKIFEKNSSIDMILEEKDCCIEKISCKIIFDHELEGEYYTPVKMRRIGVRFEEMTCKQLFNIVNFINKHLDPPPPKATRIF